MFRDVHDPEPRRSAEPLEQLLRASHPGGGEISLIDLVLLACDLSDDAGELNDLVDCVIESEAARILPADCDPMMRCVESSAEAA
jgi:hypothetical protein